MQTLRLLFLLAATGLFMCPAFAEVSTGDAAPDFTLSDVDGKTQSLSAYKGNYVVLEWFNFDCPFVKKHYDGGNMQTLQKEASAKGVVWLSINSSASGKEGNYSAADTKKMVAERGASPSAVMLDSDGAVGKLYGAKTTPHMYIINPEGDLIYQGAIDSKASADAADIASSKNYVRAALDEAMAGEPVTDATTKSYGCSVKY